MNRIPSIHAAIVRALLCCYPSAWRREYGAELADVLLTRPLSVRIIGNVFVSAFGQRVRALDATTLMGLAAMLVIVAGAALEALEAWTIVAPSSSMTAFGYLLEKTSKTFPTLVVAPMMSDFYALYLVGCGWWLHRRRGGTRSAAGVQAMKISFIAGVPVMVMGILMLTGMMGRHGLNPLAVFLAPLSRLPACWIWGCIGAQLARTVSRSARSRV